MTPLTALACAAEPRDVAVAVQRIVDHVDPDGADDPPVCANDDLREVCVRPGYDGLGHLEGATTAAVTELLLRTRDVYGTDDPPDTPVEQRRTGGQRFHDALRDALTVALDRHPGSVVGGVKTHVVVFADLMTLLGRDDLARIRPRLSQTGVIDPETARHLIATTDPTMQ
jgi:hypothetical protein